MFKFHRPLFVAKFFAFSLTSACLLSACGASNGAASSLSLGVDGGDGNPESKGSENQQNASATVAQSPDISGPRATYAAFNAFDIWANGVTQEIFDYPAWYMDGGKSNLPKDRIFVDDRNDYESNKVFVGKPSDGAVVNSNVLVYPAKEGRELQLEFSAASAQGMRQYDAISYCAKMGMRLPTARELLDYCTAGVSYTPPNYPSDARCGSNYLWTASIDPSSSWAAITFEFHGKFGVYSRETPWKAICVK